MEPCTDHEAADGGPGSPLLVLPSLSDLQPDVLRKMRSAADEVRACVDALEGGDLNLVGELLRGHDTFFELEHYPPDDVFDRRSHSQYYYHAHRGMHGEHGHFHTFLRAAGMPAGVFPVPNKGSEPWPAGSEALSHLVSISMDAYGDAIGLFAVNRWVTGDTWYAAEDVITMLDLFDVSHANPSWPVNRWISAMIRLFRPEIEALLRHRDAVVAHWSICHPGVDVFEDRALEMTGSVPIDVPRRILEIESLI